MIGFGHYSDREKGNVEGLVWSDRMSQVHNQQSTKALLQATIVFVIAAGVHCLFERRRRAHLGLRSGN